MNVVIYDMKTLVMTL